MRRTLRLLAVLALALPAVARADAPVATPNMTSVARIPYIGGTDLEITTIGGRTYVVAGAQANYNPTEDPGVRIVDVTNPAKPVVAAFLPCNSSQNDIQVRDGFVYLGIDFGAAPQKSNRRDCFSDLGPDSGPANGVAVIDIRNPRNPRTVGFVNVPGAAHNTTIHPTKPVLYVSDSESMTNSEVHIVDVSRPNKPTLVKSVALTDAGDAIHDISFNRRGTRAYVASGFTHSLVVDTADPLNPKTLSRIVDPAVNFHHQAEPTPDGRYVIITDELAGAQGLQYCPGGGLHVWDISIAATPRKVGAFYIEPSQGTEQGPRPPAAQIPFKPRRCTAHVLQLSRDGNTATMAWYSQGIQVLDLRGLGLGASMTGVPVGIQRLGSWKESDSDTWSAKMDSRGYVYTGDTLRGMDIVRFERPQAGSVSPGIWLNPEQALARGLADKAKAGPTTYFCFDRTYRSGLAQG